MDRQFDYAQRILLAVEIADAPRLFSDMPATYTRFKRLTIPDVIKTFDETHSLFAQLIAGRAFRDTLERHMGYWQKRIPERKECFVHYAIGSAEVISAAFDRLKAEPGLSLLGNQLVASVGERRVIAHGVDEFVQVNLNRFTNLPGFFNAAHEAGKHTFTVDSDYLWYGMLMSKL